MPSPMIGRRAAVPVPPYNEHWPLAWELDDLKIQGCLEPNGAEVGQYPTEDDVPLRCCGQDLRVQVEACLADQGPSLGIWTAWCPKCRTYYLIDQMPPS
jgi:hypothetical protein